MVGTSFGQSPFWNRDQRDQRDSRDWRDQRSYSPVDRKLDEIRSLYRDRRYKEASARLRQLADELDRQSRPQRGLVFPRFVGGWSLNDRNRKADDNGGFSATYGYRLGKKGIQASLHKGTRQAVQYIRMITHPGWLRKSGLESYNVQGFEAVLTADRTVHIALDRNTLLEFRGDKDTSDKELLRFASKLDLQGLRWAR